MSRCLEGAGILTIRQDAVSVRTVRLSRYLERIRAGDASARNDLLEAYAPFALSIASRVTGRYIRLGEDDEANIALMALDEAVRTFEPDKGTFLGFATQVIRRRVIDQVRRDSRRSREIPAGVRFTASDGEVEEGTQRTLPVEAAIAELAAREQEDSEARRQEILLFGKDLASYGLSLEELARVAPRHRDAREAAKEVARVLAADRGLSDYLRHRKQLPLRELELRSGVSRKSLERHRKYIIAVALILLGDYEHLSEYVMGAHGLL
jgi:RNA polymerase sigma factor